MERAVTAAFLHLRVSGHTHSGLLLLSDRRHSHAPASEQNGALLLCPITFFRSLACSSADANSDSTCQTLSTTSDRSALVVSPDFEKFKKKKRKHIVCERQCTEAG